MRVLILVLMDDALVQNIKNPMNANKIVLILVLMDDALVHTLITLENENIRRS